MNAIGDTVRLKLNPDLNDHYDTEEYCILRIGDIETSLGFVMMSTFDNLKGVIEKTYDNNPNGKRVHCVKVPVEVIVLAYDEELVDESNTGVDSGTPTPND